MSRFDNQDGDGYFRRNFKPMSQLSLDCIDSIFTRIPFVPQKLLEVGCCFGKVLERYREITGAECHGVDVSELAIAEGRKNFPHLQLRIASAAALPYEDDSFDCVFLGGCLYVQNPRDLFAIAAETDRVLQKNGFLVIHDYDSPIPYRNVFSHNTEISAYKLPFRNMFLWNPAYTLIEVQSHSFNKKTFELPIDDRSAYSILYKIDAMDPTLFPVEPFTPKP